MSTESEERLVEAAQKGHLQSFAILYERYYGAMVAVAYSVLADHGLAEDAAQETFAIACRDLPKLRRGDRFAAWLAGICRNVTRQMQRLEKRAAETNEALPAEGRGDDYRDAVRQAVWKLRRTEREPIVLRYYDNMSYEQIGSVLGISPQAVHGRLVRAKRKIAKELRRDGLSGGDYENR